MISPPTTRPRVRDIRHDAHDYLTTLGAERAGSTTWAAYQFDLRPLGGGGYLQVETHVRSHVTAHVAIERWHCQDLGDDQEAWLQTNIWPYANAWFERTRHGGFLPTPGTYSGTQVIATDLLDVLQLWVPWELEQQAKVREDR